MALGARRATTRAAGACGGGEAWWYDSRRRRRSAWRRGSGSGGGRSGERKGGRHARAASGNKTETARCGLKAGLRNHTEARFGISNQREYYIFEIVIFLVLKKLNTSNLVEAWKYCRPCLVPKIVPALQ